MSDKIYQIKVSLADSEPEIWRRILVPADLLLVDFHRIIQTTMGWENEHLHQFIKDRKYFELRTPEDIFWNDQKKVDYAKANIHLSDLLSSPKDEMIYNYDFGDDWMHDIVLEEIKPSEPGHDYPVCIAGALNCPPEDCGGFPGYEAMLEIVDNPDDEDYEEIKTWLGDYDPDHFDLDEINRKLKEDNYGCIDIDFEEW